MVNKYGLAGAVLAFLLASQPAQAPVARYYNPPKARVTIENALQIELRDSKEKFEIMKRVSEQRFEEERKKIIEDRRREEELRNYRTTDFRLDSDELLLARMIFGEAEGCPLLEKVSIAFTAINRLDKGYAKTLKEIILAPNQYSAFNPEKDSYKYLKYPLAHGAQEFLFSLQIAKDVLAGKYQDPTGGAVSYYNPSHKDMRGQIPNWAKNMTNIGRIKTGKNSYSYHIFYK